MVKDKGEDGFLGPATLGSQPWSRWTLPPGLCLECGEERPPFCHMNGCLSSLEKSLRLSGWLAEQCHLSLIPEVPPIKSALGVWK